MPDWEYGLILLAFILLGGYHVQLLRQIRRQPLSTAIGLSQQARRLWVRKIIQDGRDILAVQTLRNWTMAATLLASTAILLALGILNAAFFVEKQPELSKLFNYFGYNNEILWLLKLIILSGDFFFLF